MSFPICSKTSNITNNVSNNDIIYIFSGAVQNQVGFPSESLHYSTPSGSEDKRKRGWFDRRYVILNDFMNQH
jgi:hypothetical protein